MKILILKVVIMLLISSFLLFPPLSLLLSWLGMFLYAVIIMHWGLLIIIRNTDKKLSIIRKIISFAVICVVSIATILAIMALSFLDPLSRSEERIRETLLERMPVGTSMQETNRIVERKMRWEVTSAGEKSMSVYLGLHYHYFPFGNYVTASIDFDENSELVEISVRKSMKK